jgi:Glucosyl transferase GtrII
MVLLPVFFANRYHLEDWRRLIRGSYGWTGEGRPLTDLLLWSLNLGGSLLDISPIPQVLGILSLALLAGLLAHRFKLPPLQSALSLLPLGGGPFFLDNLSFRFDAIAMCLALVFAIVPIAINKPHRFVNASFFGAACLIASLSFYQTGINGFFVFAVAEVAWYLERNVDLRI